MSEEIQPTESTEPTETQEQVNEFQAKYERLAALERYVDALGSPEKLIELATLGYQAAQKPAEAPAPEPEPELYDPEVKTVYQEFSPKMKALEEQNRHLEAQLTELATERYKENVTARTVGVLKSFESDPALLKEATEVLNKTLQGASPQQLAALNQPEGERTLKMMLIDQFEKLATAPKKSTGAPEPSTDKSTDPRHTTRAALPANTVGVKSGVKITPQVTREIMESVTAKLGKDPKSFWN